MIAAVLPHGPLELFAFAAALALHLRARRGPLGARHILTTAAGCLAAPGARRRARDLRTAMTGGRIVLLLALAVGALALSALFATRLPSTLSVPEGRPGSTASSSPRPTTRLRRRRPARAPRCASREAPATARRR